MASPEKPPVTLYRFFDENGLKTLVDGTLKLTPPREFNDPFEILPGVPKNLAESDDEIRQLFLAENGMYRSVLVSEFHSEEKYNTWIESEIIQKRHLLPRKLKEIRNELYQGNSEAVGIACFSAYDDERVMSIDAIPHWSHYARHHTGLAISFNGHHNLFKAWLQVGALLQVSYESDRIHCKLSDFADASPNAQWEVLLRWIRQKSKRWENEIEWRLFLPLHVPGASLIEREIKGENTVYLYRLWNRLNTANASIVRSVILGARASNDLKASVATALNQKHLQHVHLYQARLDDHNFCLRLDSIRPGKSSENG